MQTAGDSVLYPVGGRAGSVQRALANRSNDLAVDDAAACAEFKRSVSFRLREVCPVPAGAKMDQVDADGGRHWVSFVHGGGLRGSGRGVVPPRPCLRRNHPR
mmetsp:Transcript_5978/g.12748  ORF Transcript_5978/g.12748 Transcript_5978/m.12748 type:complete len:102 (-) Transcript_5978:1150-1455(-)